MVWMNPNHIASEENTIPHVMNAAPMCARVEPAPDWPAVCHRPR